MGSGNISVGGGGVGSVASDMVGVMAGIKMANTVFEQMNFDSSSSKTQNEPKKIEDAWTCECGEDKNTKKFCMNCGRPKPENWTCSCGHAGNRGRFCEECGAPKPEDWDCSCGQKGNKGKFCANCGAKKA